MTPLWSSLCMIRSPVRGGHPAWLTFAVEPAGIHRAAPVSRTTAMSLRAAIGPPSARRGPDSRDLRRDTSQASRSGRSDTGPRVEIGLLPPQLGDRVVPVHPLAGDAVPVLA